MINLTINGQTVEVPEGSTILQAAEKIGITIPTLCYHKDLSSFGGCRLCVVEIQGVRLPSTACETLVTPGMDVQTESPTLSDFRRNMLEILLYNYYDAGYTRSNGTCDLDADTQFARWVRAYGIDIKKAMASRPFYPIDSDPNPYIWVDMNKCIRCTRCVRACAEVQGRFVWNLGYRGFLSKIAAGNDSTMLQARCESCGACAAYCPTGALNHKMSITRGQPDRLVATTCAYCSVGCQFDLNVKDGQIIRVTSNSEAPVNGMHLCVKGRYGYDFIHSQDRILQPRVRQYLLDGKPRPKDRGKWVEVNWDTALSIAAKGLLSAMRDGGPDSVGLITSGRYLNEEIYLMNKLARQVLGTNNIDCVEHLHYSSKFEELCSSTGLEVMSNSIQDITSHARAILVIGSNVTEQHPVLGAKIRQAVMRNGTRLVVFDPCATNISEYASLHVWTKPGAEAILLNGLMCIIFEKGWEDQKFKEQHPEGFNEFRASIHMYSPTIVEQATGVPGEVLYRAAEILATNRPMAVVWGTGLSSADSGPANLIALANLQVLLGNLGTPGGGLNSLRSQCNAQGTFDMGGIPYAYPGYQEIANRENRQKFEQAWGVPQNGQPGKSAARMLAEAGEGKPKALYILGEDLVSDTVESRSTRDYLRACQFIILEAPFSSQTLPFADIVLPGVTFAEKTGTFTSTERRIQMVHQAIEPAGDSRADWKIITCLARLLLENSEKKAKGSPFAAWEYRDTSQIMEEIACITPIYAGVSHRRLEEEHSLQWPVESGRDPGNQILPGDWLYRGLPRFQLVAS